MTKINFNAEELIALHNLLRDTIEIYRGEKEPTTLDSDRLRQIYDRIRAHFVSALSCHDKQPITTGLIREQQKVDKLRDILDDVKKEHNDLAGALKDKDYVVPSRDEDLTLPDYPNRVRKQHAGHGGRRHR